MIISILTLTVLILLYLMPTFCAVGNDKKNSGAIFALNLLLGWTLLGWMLALIWGLCKD